MTREVAKRILEETYSHWLRLKRENLLPNDECVKVAEAIDLAIEALKDRPQGEWKIEESECIYGKKFILTCSICGDSVSVTEASLPHEKYCRNCGADMRGGEE